MELRALEVTIKSIMGENRDIELVQNRQGDLDEHILSLHVGSALSDIETYLKKKK